MLCNSKSLLHVCKKDNIYQILYTSQSIEGFLFIVDKNGILIYVSDDVGQFLGIPAVS